MQNDGCKTCRLGRYPSDFDRTGVSHGTNQSCSHHVLTHVAVTFLGELGKVVDDKALQETIVYEPSIVGEMFTTSRVKVVWRRPRRKNGERRSCSQWRHLTDLEAWPNPQLEAAICMVSLKSSIGATLTQMPGTRGSATT